MRVVCRDLTNFGRSGQILVKIRQNRLNKQKRDKLVNHWSYELRKARNWTEISILERQKLSFAEKRGDSKILKRLRINPWNWRWNPLPTMLVGLVNRSGADGIWRLWNLSYGCNWRKKIVTTKFVPWFCRDNSQLFCLGTVVGMSCIYKNIQQIHYQE